MKKIEFLKEGLKNLKTIGSVARSSKYLCKGMIKHVDFENTDVIVELGAGDGVITKHILNAMKPGSILVSFEVNEMFCEQLRQIDDKRLIVVEDSAEKIGEYLKKHDLPKADYIISAIPFVVLPDELALKIVEACKSAMKKNGLFVQMHYSLITKKFYQNIFGNVDVNFVPINFPPAFVLVSQKKVS